MLVGKKGWAGIKVTVFLLSLLPFGLLVNDGINDQLGANPIETLHFGFGDWALRFLCMGLALTPIKIITGQSWPMRFRRMIGLFVFFYASLHLLIFIAFDLSLSWEAFKDEVPKSPYILMGLLTYSLLIPLAVTSTKNMQKRLGRNWIKLHRLVYIAGLTALIHYFWLVKADYTEPLIYAAVISILLAIRIVVHCRKTRKLSLRDRSRVVISSDRACVSTEHSVVKMQVLRHCVESLRNSAAYPLLLGMQRVKQDGWGRRKH
ncbi:MAG: protein-methionine-sulfoxide reductase heme-binding subunit MsrQ [Methylobacter sp.]|nr:protein-methionine-sulfoxide reductase heme-binding subunit MsrQ [Methylobacter sp.]